MKHIIGKLKYLLIFTIVISMFSSCEEEDEISVNGLGVSISPSNSSFTYLDDIIIDLEVEGASSVTVAQKGGAELGEVSISNGEGTFTTAPGNIDFNEDGIANLEFSASLDDGDRIRKFFQISIGSPLSITPPAGLIQDDTERFFKYNITTVNADPEQVTVETKINSQNYSAESGDWAMDSDSLAVVGSNYDLNDTIWFKVTAVRGDESVEMESSAIVGMNTFANESGQITFQGDTAYNLVSDSYVTTGTDSSDIEFNLVTIMNKLGFESHNGTMFVEATMEDYNTGNMVALRDKFEHGDQVSSVGDVEIGDVYLFGAPRDGETHIGILKITDTFRTNDDNSDSFTFQYKF